MQKAPALYQKYFIDQGIERLSLFRNLWALYSPETALYPGSFVHVSPSFYFPEVVYLDLDKRCQKFFSDEQTWEFVKENKEYTRDPVFRFYEQSFEEPLPEELGYFDVLISQYSGFISRYCTPYLKPKGILVVNDSHGDATYAYHSGEYELVGVVDEQMEITTHSLENYFTFTRKKQIDLEKVIQTMKGPKYSKMAYSYLFQKAC